MLQRFHHFKPTETFQYTPFSFCHAPEVKKGFIIGEALRLLRANSSKTTFEENIKILDHTCRHFNKNRKSAKYINAFCHTVQSISAQS